MPSERLTPPTLGLVSRISEYPLTGRRRCERHGARSGDNAGQWNFRIGRLFEYDILALLAAIRLTLSEMDIGLVGN